MKRYHTLRSGILLTLFFLVFAIACNTKIKSLSQNDSDAIQKYLDEKVMQPSFGGRVFSAFKLLKQESGKLNIWAYMQEYYRKDGKMEIGSGWSVPMVINIEETSSGIKIKDHFTPGDGDRFSEDIRAHFPGDIQKQIFDFPGTPDMRNLENTSKQRAEKFFN
jgi:hypothetical protein